MEFTLVEDDVPVVPARLTGFYHLRSRRLLGRHIVSTQFPASHVGLGVEYADLDVRDHLQDCGQHAETCTKNRDGDDVLDGVAGRYLHGSFDVELM